MEYEIEGGANSTPFVNNNRDLVLTDINGMVHQVMGRRVRVPRRRTVRSNQSDDFEYSQRPNLQTSEGEFFRREYGNIHRIDRQLRERALELVSQA